MIIPVGEEPPSMLSPEQEERLAEKAEKAKAKKHTKPTAKDRFWEINAFVDYTAATLDRAELIVWLTLWRDAKEGVSRTSQSDLARRGGITDRSVRRALVALEGKGLLRVVYQGGFHRGLSVYRVRPIDKH